MSPKFVNFELILIYFLLLIPWPHTSVIQLLCSRDSSRLVRKIVRSKWTPVLDKYQVKLPLECPLHPFRDLFAPRQDAKKRDRPTQWTCRLCGKSFYQEKYLDQHFDTRHKAIMNQAEDAVCLADLCDIMRCEVFQSEESSSLKTPDQNVITDIEVWGDSLGQSSALAKANAAYLSLIPLRTSSIGAVRTKAHSRQLCPDKVGQNRYKDNAEKTAAPDRSVMVPNELPAKGHGGGSVSASGNSKTSAPQATQPKATSKSPAAATTAKKPRHAQNKGQAGSARSTKGSKEDQPQDETINSTNNRDGYDGTERAADGTGAGGSGDDADEDDDVDVDGAGNQTANANSTAVPKLRAHCKAEELSKLKTKCEQLVRGCIAGLLLSMNDQSFKEMEEEMNKAVCWYLSCDRYWEDGPLEPRAFPWGLILILIFVLSTGICFCYYIIWILFDSEESTINSHHHTNTQHHYQQFPPLGAVQQHYYYQQQQQQHQHQQHQQQQHQQQQVHNIYPEQPQYEYRHSPRHHHYIVDQRPQAVPNAAGTIISSGSQSTTATPLHHHHQTNLGYQQDILDRRDYISRPIATTAVTSGAVLGGSNNSATNSAAAAAVASGAVAAAAASMSANQHAATLDCDRSSTMGGSSSGGGAGAGAGGGSGRHYNTHPRPLATHHRYVGASQQSLRGSSSSHEIIQNEVGQNEHYIYVTYPPDLKKRFFEKYE